jgi:hypothetical protein
MVFFVTFSAVMIIGGFAVIAMMRVHPSRSCHTVTQNDPEEQAGS